MSTQSPGGNELDYEEEHVHQVYQAIAQHFSSTRYKPWPIVHEFLRSVPVGSIGLDAGCGNGKYLTVNPNIFIVGSDRSSELVSIASKHQPHDALVADSLSLPHPDNAFDFAISIAVIHHLSTKVRRIAAVHTLLQFLKPSSSASVGGKLLVFVWALEQKSSRRGWDVGDDQDVMVPWVTKQKQSQDDSGKDANMAEQTFLRYYHLYRSGELEDDIEAAGGQILDSGYEKDNWWATATRRSDSSE